MSERFTKEEAVLLLRQAAHDALKDHHEKQAVKVMRGFNQVAPAILELKMGDVHIVDNGFIYKGYFFTKRFSNSHSTIDIAVPLVGERKGFFGRKTKHCDWIYVKSVHDLLHIFEREPWPYHLLKGKR